MKHDCLTIEELEKIEELSPNDPRRLHAASCPRCASLLDNLRLFNDPSHPAPGADPEDAARRLAKVLDPRRLPLRGRKRPIRRQWWLLAGAAAVILISLSLQRETQKNSSPLVLRGEAQMPEQLPQGEAHWRDDGALKLSWPVFPGGDAVEVVFLALDLREVARIPAPQGDHLVLNRDALPSPLREGHAVLWSAVAMEHGEEIAHTARQLLEP